MDKLKAIYEAPIKLFIFFFISMKLLIGQVGKFLGLVQKAGDVYREATIKQPEPMVIEGKVLANSSNKALREIANDDTEIDVVTEYDDFSKAIVIKPQASTNEEIIADLRKGKMRIIGSDFVLPRKEDA